MLIWKRLSFCSVTVCWSHLLAFMVTGWENIVMSQSDYTKLTFYLVSTPLATWEQCSWSGRHHFQDEPTHTETSKPPHGWSWHPRVSWFLILLRFIFEILFHFAWILYTTSWKGWKQRAVFKDASLFTGVTLPTRPWSLWSPQWCQTTTWRARPDWAASTALHAQPHSTRGPGHTGRAHSSLLREWNKHHSLVGHRNYSNDWHFLSYSSSFHTRQSVKLISFWTKVIISLT